MTTMGNYLKPSKAIVIYSGEETDYAEIHNINDDGNFEAGRPFRAEEIKAFSQIVDSEKTLQEQKCFPYRNILGYQSDLMEDTVAWIYPAGKVKLHYSGNVKGLKTKLYFIPHIVFISNGKSITVHAIKGNDILKLTEKTQLYKAPFMNVNSDWTVCMGSAKVKKFHDVNEMIQSIEDAFFESTFTHTNYNKIVKGGIVDCYANQSKKFDEKLLLPSIKLKEIWK